MPAEEVAEEIECEERVQSEEGGVSVAYLLSEDFLQLAQERTNMDDPTFYDIKDGVFFGTDAIGRNTKCPRDHMPGCSLLDSLPRRYRRKCTHFLSWTWAYRIKMFRACLHQWTQQEKLDPNDVFLFCCFFANNQYRILVDEVTNGSDNLSAVFETRLRRIGRMVAMIDTWKQPTYLTRVWTIFEQATAANLDIPVTMLLPPDASRSLIANLELGKHGITAVQFELLQIDSESAEASKPADEARVKEHIQQTLGFKRVNMAVAQSMMAWIGQVVCDHFELTTSFSGKEAIEI